MGENRNGAAGKVNDEEPDSSQFLFSRHAEDGKVPHVAAEVNEIGVEEERTTKQDHHTEEVRTRVQHGVHEIKRCELNGQWARAYLIRVDGDAAEEQTHDSRLEPVWSRFTSEWDHAVQGSRWLGESTTPAYRKYMATTCSHTVSLRRTGCVTALGGYTILVNQFGRSS